MSANTPTSVLGKAFRSLEVPAAFYVLMASDTCISLLPSLPSTKKETNREIKEKSDEGARRAKVYCGSLFCSPLLYTSFQTNNARDLIYCSFCCSFLFLLTGQRKAKKGNKDVHAYSRDQLPNLSHINAASFRPRPQTSRPTCRDPAWMR